MLDRVAAFCEESSVSEENHEGNAFLWVAFVWPCKLYSLPTHIAFADTWKINGTISLLRDPLSGAMLVGGVVDALVQWLQKSGCTGTGISEESAPPALLPGSAACAGKSHRRCQGRPCEVRPSSGYSHSLRRIWRTYRISFKETWETHSPMCIAATK